MGDPVFPQVYTQGSFTTPPSSVGIPADLDMEVVVYEEPLPKYIVILNTTLTVGSICGLISVIFMEVLRAYKPFSIASRVMDMIGLGVVIIWFAATCGLVMYKMRDCFNKIRDVFRRIIGH
jgi:hypothetical protein